MDTTFYSDEGIFNFRVGAIIICESKILMVHSPEHNQYYSVGGRCKFNETTEQAIVRECKEETNVDFEIDRLGFVCENFFNMDFKRVHEISFFYYMKTKEDISKIHLCGTDFLNSERLVWIELDDVENIENLYPEFFKSELKNFCEEIRHVIIKE